MQTLLPLPVKSPLILALTHKSLLLQGWWRLWLASWRLSLRALGQAAVATPSPSPVPAAPALCTRFPAPQPPPRTTLVSAYHTADCLSLLPESDNTYCNLRSTHASCPHSIMQLTVRTYNRVGCLSLFNIFPPVISEGSFAPGKCGLLQKLTQEILRSNKHLIFP